MQPKLYRRNQRQAHAAVIALAQQFPAAFVRGPLARMPLKIGIHEDLLARGVDRRTLKVGLGSYARSEGYLRSLCKVGAVRVDLDGKPAGAVTLADAADAQHKLAAKLELLESKRPLQNKRPPLRRAG